MIGRLLQSAASTFGQHGAQRSHPGLESVTEETHTRDLLFPDPATLRASLSQSSESPLLGSARTATAREAANFDDRGGLDISFPSDVRLIIAQDANARYHQPQVLYDSKPARSGSIGGDSRGSSPPVDVAPQRQLSRGKSMTSPAITPRHRHTPSGGSFFSPSGFLPLSPLSPRSPDKPRPGFGELRTPRASPFDQTSTEPETTQVKIAREAKEETEALLGCMFGAPGFRLEPGTKLHILPKKAPESQSLSKSLNTTTRPISSGGFQRKRTPLVRSTSAADVSRGTLPSANHEGTDTRPSGSKPSILFTRLFTVPVQDNVAHDNDGTNACPESPIVAQQSNDKDAATKPRQPKQKKVPMYAIAVVLQLPSEITHRLRPSPSQQGLSSLGSSLNDSTPSNSWRAEQTVFASFMEARSAGQNDSVLNSHLPQILLHWNIVSRALELLELTAKVRLGALLEEMTPFTPLNLPPTPKPGLGKMQKPNKTTQQSVYVPAGCLQGDPSIRKLSEATSQRIVNGLRTRRVVIGQGRWGAWREEARWIGRWAGGRDQNFFLFNVLTAFLGSHTEWMETLAPPWYRRRHRQRKTSNIIRARTVIISSDKMASRRLIFLLASFIPSHFNHHQALPTISHSQQLPYSESPPGFADQREPATRRTGTQKSSLGRTNGGAHARSVSFSLNEHNEEGIDDATRSRARRDSDVKSMKSPALVIPHTGGSDSRKASMSTVIADSAQPVPHFSNLSYEPPSPQVERHRAGSGGSLASMALTHNLKRSESGTGSTSGSGKWGSMVSGFWSNRRDSSTDDSDVFTSQDSPRRAKFPHHEHRHSTVGLERMVAEVSALRESGAAPNDVQGGSMSGSPRRHLQLEDCLRPRHPALSETSAAARSIPRPKKPERMPLKLSFNEDEGYIDIAMDSKEQSFPSSLASSFTSVRPPFLGGGGGGFGAFSSITSANEHWSPYGSITSDAGSPHAEPALDAAGWLKTFQPDFVLQAVAPYDELRTDLEAAMRADALLHAEQSAAQPDLAASFMSDASMDEDVTHPWRPVSDTLVADTSRFTIERVRAFSRPRSKPAPRRSRSHSTTSISSALTMPPTTSGSSPAAPPLEDPRFEVRMSTEPVMDLDPTLIDAVERILALSGTSSRASSPQRSGANSVAPESGSFSTAGLTPTASTFGAGQNGSAHKSSTTPSAAGPTASSRPASIRARQAGSHLKADDNPAIAAASGAGSAYEGPGAETRRAVLGALEEVMRTVVEEWEREAVANGSDGHRRDAEGDGVTAQRTRGKSTNTKKKDGRKEESTLREGVRRWLREVEVQ